MATKSTFHNVLIAIFLLVAFLTMSVVSAQATPGSGSDDNGDLFVNAGEPHDEGATVNVTPTNCTGGPCHGPATNNPTTTPTPPHWAETPTPSTGTPSPFNNSPASEDDDALRGRVIIGVVVAVGVMAVGAALVVVVLKRRNNAGDTARDVDGTSELEVPLRIQSTTDDASSSGGSSGLNCATASSFTSTTGTTTQHTGTSSSVSSVHDPSLLMTPHLQQQPSPLVASTSPPPLVMDVRGVHGANVYDEKTVVNAAVSGAGGVPYQQQQQTVVSSPYGAGVLPPHYQFQQQQQQQQFGSPSMATSPPPPPAYSNTPIHTHSVGNNTSGVNSNENSSRNLSVPEHIAIVAQQQQSSESENNTVRLPSGVTLRSKMPTSKDKVIDEHLINAEACANTSAFSVPIVCVNGNKYEKNVTVSCSHGPDKRERKATDLKTLFEANGSGHLWKCSHNSQLTNWERSKVVPNREMKLILNGTAYPPVLVSNDVISIFDALGTLLEFADSVIATGSCYPADKAASSPKKQKTIKVPVEIEMKLVNPPPMPQQKNGGNKKRPKRPSADAHPPSTTVFTSCAEMFAFVTANQSGLVNSNSSNQQANNTTTVVPPPAQQQQLSSTASPLHYSHQHTQQSASFFPPNPLTREQQEQQLNFL